MRFQTNDYSVPVAYVYHQVWVRGYVEQVVIGCGTEIIARHRRSYEGEDTVFDPLHYLPLIERKLGALDQAAPLAGWELPDAFATLRRLMEARSRRPKPNPDPLGPPHPHARGGSVLLRPLVWFLPALDRLHEKGGRYNVVPAHHVAQEYVDAYLEAARIGDDRRGPSCGAASKDAAMRSRRRGEKGISRLSAFKMIKRRARKAGLPAENCAHSFRGTGITEYLRNGGDLEVAARIAGHGSTRTTQLYNLLREEISLDEIERIHI